MHPGTISIPRVIKLQPQTQLVIPLFILCIVTQLRTTSLLFCNIRITMSNSYRSVTDNCVIEPKAETSSRMASIPPSDSQRSLSLASPEPSLYFGYGSNLWLSQMAKRCPTSIYMGLAILRDWRWIINARGYANVVPSPGDCVYGLVYELSGEDEEMLDVNEGVPYAYVKRSMNVEFWGDRQTLGGRGKVVKGLMYVDEKRVVEGTPREEYVYRMNMGIHDAVERGVPIEYVERYMRPFIPDEKGELVERKTILRVVQ